MSNSLSSLPYNLTEGLSKNKCEDCKSGFKYITVNDGFNC